MGIFKRKPKENSASLRAQQQQLGDDLLNRSTPLLQHRYSNSNLSVSPSSFVYALDDQVTSPVASGFEEDQAYFDEQNYTPSLTTSLSPNSTVEHAPRPSSSQPVSILKKTNSISRPHDDYENTVYYDEQEEYQNKQDYYQQPVISQKERDQRLLSGYEKQPMIMEHTPVSRRGSNSYRPDLDRGGEDYYNYDRSNDVPSSHRQNEEPAYFNDSIVVNKRRGVRQQTYEEEDYYQPPPIDARRRSKPIKQHYLEDEYYTPHIVPDEKRRSKPIHQSFDDDYYQAPSVNDVKRRSKSLYHTHEDEEYYQLPPVKDIRRISKQPQDEEEYYSPHSVTTEARRRSKPISQTHDEEYYQPTPAIDTRRRSHSPQEEEEYYQKPIPSDSRRRSYLLREEDAYFQTPTPSDTRRSKQSHQDYYGLSAKLTPFMMEEWEIALDDLCDLYPRLDRHYINDFLRSAQGDFVTAKSMIMEMIMDIR